MAATMGTEPATRSRRRRSPGVHPVDGLTLPAVRPAPPFGDLEHLEPHPAVRVLAGEPDERTSVEDFDPHLLPKLASEGGARALARLELAAGELPLACEMASGQALGREHPPVGPAQDTHRDMDRLGLPAGGHAISHSGPLLRLPFRFLTACEARVRTADFPGARASSPHAR